MGRSGIRNGFFFIHGVSLLDNAPNFLPQLGALSEKDSGYYPTHHYVIQGYALLSTALNYKNQHSIVHELAEIAFERLKQQEKTLGSRFNDWQVYSNFDFNFFTAL